ncbi:MAG: glutamate--tRNA ligase [Patescibacteria group bacterium]|jgi:glutamyl-tRNA synthetase
MKKVIVRFAPSPTGSLHIGGLRTALFNWLWARKNIGKIILRIEDTDRERFVEGAVENIIEALHWYGLDFDEGPIFQSARTDIYKKYAKQLIDKGFAYHCFCSSERLDELRKLQAINKIASHYDGHCRNLTAGQIAENLKNKKLFVIRMKVPQTGATSFEDEIYGHVSVENNNIDDQIIVKSDGFPTYHLANVVDDHEMEISHVIRAEEWLPSTPKHIILYNAFGWQPPVFAHLPMVLGTDRSKLSKRHGAVAALSFREQGYLPEAILNFIALLGWNPKNNKEVFTVEELKKEFDLKKVNKSGAIFNLEKLDWLNGFYIRQMGIDKLTELCLPFMQKKPELKKAKSIVSLFQGRMKKLTEVDELSRFIFSSSLEYEADLLIPKKETKGPCLNALVQTRDYLNSLSESDFNKNSLRDKFMEFIKNKALNNKIVLWPLRVAITGLASSPDVFEVAEVLGKEEVLARISTAINSLQKT